jgi:hypothetical protein
MLGHWLWTRWSISGWHAGISDRPPVFDTHYGRQRPVDFNCHFDVLSAASIRASMGAHPWSIRSPESATDSEEQVMAGRLDSSITLCLHLHLRTSFRDIDFCHDRLPSGSDWLLWTRGESRQYNEATREFDTTGLRILRC